MEYKGIYYHHFDLSPYRLDTRKIILFFDCLMKEKEIKKEPCLESLFIATTSYRKARRINQNIAKVIIKQLNHFFHIAPLDEEIGEYEETLSKIYSDIYMRFPIDIPQMSFILEGFIAKENALKPIFTLFLIFLKISDSSKAIRIILDEIRPLFHFVSYYYAMLTDEFKQMYFMVELFLSDIKKFNIDEKISDCNGLSYTKGLSYFYLSTKYYVERMYENALIFALEAEKVYETENNYQRLIITRNNICGMYNVLELYNLAYEYEKKQLNIVLSNLQFDQARMTLVNQYLTTLYMLKRYEEILSFLSGGQYDYGISKMYINLCYFQMGKLEEVKKRTKGITPDNEILLVSHLLYLKITQPKEFNRLKKQEFPQLGKKMQNVIKTITR